MTSGKHDTSRRVNHVRVMINREVLPVFVNYFALVEQMALATRSGVADASYITSGMGWRMQQHSYNEIVTAGVLMDKIPDSSHEFYDRTAHNGRVRYAVLNLENGQAKII